MLVFMLALIVLLPLPISAAYPKHDDYVSDKQSVLSSNTVSALRNSNERLLENRGVLIAVCVTNTTGDEDIASYTRALFQEWSISAGVLLVVDTEAKDYFAVQSMDIDNVLTNEELSDILMGYMEDEFADGNVDRGVYKTILKLDEFLTAYLPAVNNGDTAEIGNAPADGENEADEGEETSGFVKALKGIFTVLLVLIILAVVLIGGLFVAALFNDTAMELFQTYVMGMLLRRNVNTGYAGTTYEYDDRLYGNPAPQNRKNNGSAQNRGYNNYYDGYGYGKSANGKPSAKQRTYDPYYDYAAQYPEKQSRPANRQNPAGQNQRQYNNGQYNGYTGEYGQNGYYPPQNQYRTGKADNRSRSQNRQQQYYDDYR